MSDERDKLYELCVECQRRVGTLLLALLLLSALYWLSFLLFVDDPRRTLIGPARNFVARIDELEQDQLVWQTIHLADIARIAAIGDQYTARLERLPEGDPAKTSRIDLNVQLRLSDRLLTDYLSRTQVQNYVELVQRWLLEVKDLSLNKIVYTSEILGLYVPYETLNLPPGWLSATASALGLKDVVPVPAELDTLPWQELRQRRTLLFASWARFEADIRPLQTLWQGEITDEMQARTLHGTGIWLRNLESGRSIAQGFIRKEPSIRLPLLGENISGRWAFYLGPLAFLILLRYLRLLVQHIRALETELRVVRDQEYPSVVLSKDDNTLPRLARYPNLIEVLRADPAPSEGTSRSRVNLVLVAAVLFLPASTVVPVMWIDWLIAGPITRLPLVLLAAAMYAVLAYDSQWLLRYYLGPVATTGAGNRAGPDQGGGAVGTLPSDAKRPEG